MSMSSYQQADSMVELSLSPLFHYQFSSVFKPIDGIACTSNYTIQAKKIRDYCLKYAKPSKRVRLQTDVTPLIKEHSPTLEERQIIKKSNNVIKGNKPLGIGYPLSSINLSCESKWSQPLMRGRVPVDQTESSFAVGQIEELIPELVAALGCDIIINTTDCSYTHAAYLSPLYQQEKLVCISRFRYGTKVFTCAKGDNTRGAPKIYDQCFYLRNETQIAKGIAPKTGMPYEKEQITIYDLPCSEQQILSATTKKGRPLTIQLYRWNDLKIRTKNGHSMKDKPFDLVGCRVIDTDTGELLFKRDLFFCIFGKKKKKFLLKNLTGIIGIATILNRLFDSINKNCF